MTERHSIVEEYLDEKVASLRALEIARHWEQPIVVKQSRRGWRIVAQLDDFGSQRLLWRVLEQVCPPSEEQLGFDREGLELEMGVPVGTLEEARRLWHTDIGFTDDELRDMRLEEASTVRSAVLAWVRSRLVDHPDVVLQFDSCLSQSKSATKPLRDLGKSMLMLKASEDLHPVLELGWYADQVESELLSGRSALSLIALIRWSNVAREAIAFVASTPTEKERVALAHALYAIEPNMVPVGDSTNP